jgi:hypothetical protein
MHRQRAIKPFDRLIIRRLSQAVDGGSPRPGKALVSRLLRANISMNAKLEK